MIAELNDYKLKLAFRDHIFDLKEGELIVVPKGVEHKPVCDSECTIMLIETKNTLNTGNAGGPLTDTNLEWI